MLCPNLDIKKAEVHEARTDDNHLAFCQNDPYSSRICMLVYK